MGHRWWATVAVAVVMTACASGTDGTTGTGDAAPRADAALPAVGTAVVDRSGAVEVEVSGVRRWGDPDPVTEQDPWHLGSETKAMTATLAAILVEDGLLEWDSTVGDTLGVDADLPLAHATLAQLLTHTAGVPADLPRQHPDLWQRLREAGSNDVVRTRRWLASRLAASPLASDPGTAVEYANGGYVIAGSMLEAATTSTWEQLMQDKLFEPLGMTCGFGAPTAEAPWGHRPGDPPTPISPGPAADNPPALGPAGTVHCDLESWARFVALHLRGATGDTEVLSRETFERLHTPPADAPGNSYAYGWIATTRDWAGGTALTHSGSNGLWHATAWLAPRHGRAYLAITNTGDAHQQLDRRIASLIDDQPPS